MDSINSNSANNISSLKVYTLIVIFFILSVVAVIPFVIDFQQNNGCEEYLNLAREQNFTPGPCFQYSFLSYVVPAVVKSLPFLFIMFVLLLKEKKKEYQFIKGKQEKIAFRLLIFTVLLFLLFFVLINSLNYMGGLVYLFVAPLTMANYTLLLLIFGFSLWLIRVRYQWSKRNFLAMIVGLVFLVYFLTPSLVRVLPIFFF